MSKPKCSECGKVIEDKVMQCPECPAITCMGLCEEAHDEIEHTGAIGFGEIDRFVHEMCMRRMKNGIPYPEGVL